MPEGTSKARLSDYACTIFPAIPSRKGIKKAIKRGAIIVDGKPAETGRWVIPGMKIDWIYTEHKVPKKFELELEVVYEDEQLAVIWKPAGLVVSGNQFRTVENALAHNVQRSTQQDALQWARPIHRLDAPTSGLLLVAKTMKALVSLSRQFEQQKIKKKYAAVVIGKTPEQGVFEQAIEDKPAYTRFERIDCVSSLRNTYLSLLYLYPKTGRTHQLRRHLADADFPIMGDKLYGTTGEILKGKGLFLTALELSFLHPETEEELTISMDVPYKFTALLAREQRRWERINCE